MLTDDDDPTVWNPGDYPKRQRTRLAKAELWMMFATSVEGWRESVADEPGCRTIPFAKWPADDPMVDLVRRYGLTADDLARLLNSIGDQLETKAMNAGYEDAWVS